MPIACNTPKEEGRAGLDDERAEETQFYVALFERPEPIEALEICVREATVKR